MSDTLQKNRIYSIFEELEREIDEELQLLEELCISKRTLKQFSTNAEMSMEIIKQTVAEYEKKLAKELNM
jgi:hypothetical protein